MLNNIFSLLLLLVLYRPPRRNLYANTDKNQEKITNLEKRQKKLTALQRVFFTFQHLFSQDTIPGPTEALLRPISRFPKIKLLKLI